ncbi:hypothetical protein BUL40_11280 [Croceivirga radicis]|uniref:Cell division protein ZapB n=1 Tax=Croceivirga radicis TaxID=1929488 RepID=A0A1V6LQ94_9FLAO|nr:hypothetical protein [Croceivirga radicis]OQD42342.1 hypothetical protein BUL40_11280 [Croceivirga radicis]
MAELVDLVDSLENKISKLLHKLELLKQTNEELERNLEVLKSQRQVDKEVLLEWEEKYKSLKLASTMVGGNTNKTEAKLKINALIREIDSCIAQLAE